MRKIFIDCGANDGCSLRMFSTVFKDYQDFSAYSFECSDEFYAELVSTGNEIGFKEFFPFKKAVWISEGKKRYHVQSHSLEVMVWSQLTYLSLYLKISPRTIT